MQTPHDRSSGHARDRWADRLTELPARIAHRCAPAEVRERAARSLTGLLGRVERTPGWQVTDAIGTSEPRSVQRLLSEAGGDAEGVRDDRRAYGMEHRSEPARGVLIIADTGFVTKGDPSVGVARQDTGTVGDTAHAQVGVFLASAATQGTASLIAIAPCSFPVPGPTPLSAVVRQALRPRCGSPPT
jgi:SRSO17 transposase